MDHEKHEQPQADLSKNSELVKWLAANKFTDEEGYNLVVADLFEAVPQEMVESEAGQRIIAYFLYKVQRTLFPAIRALQVPDPPAQPMDVVEYDPDPIPPKPKP